MLTLAYWRLTLCTLAPHPLPQGVEYDDKLKKELVMSVREQIGAFAAPDVIHWAPGLPKTRSGKIMRRGEWGWWIAARLDGHVQWAGGWDQQIDACMCGRRF